MQRVTKIILCSAMDAQYIDDRVGARHAVLHGLAGGSLLVGGSDAGLQKLQ